MSVLRGVAIAAVTLYAAYQALGLVVVAESLQVSRVAVHGNEQLSSERILAMLDRPRLQQNILQVDLDGLRRQLLASPWLAEAEVRRVLPSTIEVTVAERQPIGIGRAGAQLYLVDASGTVIDAHGPQYAHFDLPIIDGLATSESAGATVGFDEARAALAAQVLEATGADPELAQRISQIDVRDLRDAIVMLDDDPALIHLGTGQFAERLQNYVNLAPALRARVSEIDYVDLRFGDRIYVRPAGRSSRSGARPAGPPSATGRRF